jgi:hypothetical protein
MRGATVGWVAGLLLATATGGCDVEPATCASGACGPHRTVNWQFTSNSPEDVDVLFVVDDSAPLPAALIAAYPRMATVLQNLPPLANAISRDTAPPSVHVAFIPASFAGSGSCAPAATRGSACGLTGLDPFLSTIACGQRPNFAGSMEDAFTCLADFDVAPACGAPQPFAAIRRALAGDGSSRALRGFSRPGATLQVVILAAHDDASPEGDDAASLAALLRAAKPGPGQVIVSVVGPSETCTSDPELAAPAPRLLALAQAFGSRGLYASVCGQSAEEALMFLGDRLAVLIEPACLAGIRDTDPVHAGVQPTCAVEEQTTQADGSVTLAALPSCDAAPAPCWRLSANPTLCLAALRFELDHGAGWCPQLPAIVRVSCIGCVDPADPACAAGDVDNRP